MSKFLPARPSPYRRIALVGPSGSGKTYGALSLATAGLEHAALLSLEAAPPLGFPLSFDACQAGDLNGLLTLIRLAADQRYPAIVLDCLSSVWMGSKGLLQLVDQHQGRGWGMVDAELAKLYAAIHAYPGHVIATFRAEEIRLVKEVDGVHRVQTQVGKVAFKGDFGAQFDTVLECVGGGLVEVRKGPPSVYGQLVRLDGDTQDVLIPPASRSQPSPAALGAIPPREAVAETSPPPYSTPSETGTGIPASESRAIGQREATDIEEYQEFLRGARKLAGKALSLGVSQESIRQAWVDNGGLTNVNGQFSGCPRNCWESAMNALTALGEAAIAETETPWGLK